MSEERRKEEYVYWRGGERRSRPVYVIECCGTDIWCVNFTQTCEHCEADYNFSGHRLAPRSQWGEDTGEDWKDCY